MLSAQEIYLRAPDIEAVHRLGQRERGRTRTVICRFVNRKNAFAAMKYQKDLKNTNHFKNLWITENLCPTHRRIFNILYKHHKKGLIFDVKSRNGLIYAKMNEGDERKKIALRRLNSLLQLLHIVTLKTIPTQITCQVLLQPTLLSFRLPFLVRRSSHQLPHLNHRMSLHLKRRLFLPLSTRPLLLLLSIRQLFLLLATR